MNPKGKSRLPTALLAAGSVMLAVLLVIDGLFPAVSLPEWLVMVLVACGSVLLCTGLILHQRSRPGVADERFVLHRLRSSRFGLLVGLIAVLVLAFYNLLVKGELPWELLIVAASMAVGKVAAMVYFRAIG